MKKALADCAVKYLTPTVSTVNVERLFSTAGDIVTDERNRLKTENASKILLTRESLPIINFRYDDYLMVMIGCNSPQLNLLSL